MRLVMIDNYDSFTYNLVQLFNEFEIEVRTFRNDQITPRGIEELEPDWICISPGPKDPEHSGISKAVIAHFAGKVPVLGVCLGMQAINEAFGGRTREAPVPVHGKTCLAEHGGEDLFRGIPSPFRVARYHSLCIEIGSEALASTAVSPDGVVMGVKHISLPIYGVQFHPESFLTEYGLELAENFLSTQESWKAPVNGAGSSGRFPRVDFALLAPCGSTPPDEHR